MEKCFAGGFLRGRPARCRAIQPALPAGTGRGRRRCPCGDYTLARRKSRPRFFRCEQKLLCDVLSRMPVEPIRYFHRAKQVVETEKVYGEGWVRWTYESKGGS